MPNTNPEPRTSKPERPGSLGARRYPDRPYVGVGAVIVADGKVLLVKRKHEPLAGEWSIPGGAVELGETLEDCVSREMLEETGLQIAVGPVIEVFDRITRDETGQPSSLPIGAAAALRRSPWRRRARR